MIILTIDMLGWAPIIGYPITGQTSYSRMQLPNQGSGKPDMLSQNAQAQTGYQCEHALDRGAAKAQILRQAELL